MKITHEIDLTHLAPPEPDGFMIGQDGLPPCDLREIEKEAIKSVGITLHADDEDALNCGLCGFYRTRADADAVLEEMRRQLPDGPPLSLIEIKEGEIRRAR